MRRSLLLLVAATASGCSLLLDFGEAGLACDAQGQCLPGYVCDASNACVPEGSPTATCNPKCGALEKCVKATCVPQCDGRACAAGETCNDSSGLCEAGARNREIGAGCENDSQCNQGLFCLAPYGQTTNAVGVCSKPCVDATDCSGTGTVCAAFKGTREGGLALCVPESFKPCDKERDCTGSGLSCGIYAITPFKKAVSACRARAQASSGGASIGERCSTLRPCANGLCQASGNGETRCTTPCQTKADCEETANTQEATRIDCLEVTVNVDGSQPLPRVRPKLCVPEGLSATFACTSPVNCHIDAPDCVLFDGQSSAQCAPVCADDTSARCPSGLKCSTNHDGTGAAAGRELCGPQ